MNEYANANANANANDNKVRGVGAEWRGGREEGGGRRKGKVR